jgi:DNA-binding CsgD family transcriptional regulator
VSLPHSRLVGRDAELLRLEGSAVAAAAGRGGAVLITGEPGIGKTRLIKEATSLAAGRDFIVLTGRAHALEQELAYAPLVEAFGRCLRGLSPKRRAALLSGLGDLGRLFRDLELTPPPIGDPALERTRLFSALATLLERLAAEAPILLTIDDLHWADHASLELLHYLARTLDGQRVLLLLTCRGPFDDATGGVRKLLQSLRRLGLLEEIALVRLAPGAVTEMASAILGADVPEDVAGMLRARASGVPLFVETILRSLMEQGRLLRASSGWALVQGNRAQAEVPAVVRDLVAERLATVSASERRVLDAIAVSGGATPAELLGRACELGAEELTAALARLLGGELVTEETDGSGQVLYGASHPLLLEVLYGELTEPARRKLHLAFALGLELQGADLPALARHYRGAGDLADPERTLDALLAAGEAALGIFADEEAAGHFAAVLARVRRGQRPELLPDVLERLGVAWNRGGKNAAAITVWSEASELRERASDLTSVSRLRHAIARALWELGRLDEARVELERACASTPDVRQRARLLQAQTDLLERLGDLPGAGRTLAELQTLADGCGEARLAVDVKLAESRLELARREHGPSSSSVLGALGLATELADEALLLRVLDLAAAVAMERADVASIERHTQAALDLARRLSSPSSQMRAYGLRSFAWFARGRLREAERDAESAHVIAHRFQIARGLARCPTMLAMLAVQRGELERAAALLEQAKAAGADVARDRYVHATFALTEAWLALEHGSPLDAARREVLGSDGGDAWVMRLLALGELELRDGHVERALAIAERIRRADDGDGCTAIALLLEGLATARRADTETLSRARALCETAGLRFHAARAAYEAASLRRDEGAARAVDEARLLFEELETKRWADRARKKLRELGERPPPRRRPGPQGGPLSRRELEVATLFAQGLTTSEVAERLIISPHTAAAHLQRIYQRLEVHSRVALARSLTEHGLLP